MEDIKNLIKDYLGNWKECDECNSMCDSSNYAIIKDIVVCMDCILK